MVDLTQAEAMLIHESLSEVRAAFNSVLGGTTDNMKERAELFLVSVGRLANLADEIGDD